MAKANETAGKPAVDPAKKYRVKLSRAIQIVPGVWARPLDHDIVMKGSAVAAHGNAIASYEEV